MTVVPIAPADGAEQLTLRVLRPPLSREEALDLVFADDTDGCLRSFAIHRVITLACEENTQKTWTEVLALIKQHLSSGLLKHFLLDVTDHALYEEAKALMLSRYPDGSSGFGYCVPSFIKDAFPSSTNLHLANRLLTRERRLYLADRLKAHQKKESS